MRLEKSIRQKDSGGKDSQQKGDMKPKMGGKKRQRKRG